MNVKVVLRSA